MAAAVSDLMRGMAALAGFAWTDDELRAIAPLVERSLALVEKLEALPIRDVEPSTIFRMT